MTIKYDGVCQFISKISETLDIVHSSYYYHFDCLYLVYKCMELKYIYFNTAPHKIPNALNSVTHLLNELFVHMYTVSTNSYSSCKSMAQERLICIKRPVLTDSIHLHSSRYVKPGQFCYHKGETPSPFKRVINDITISKPKRCTGSIFKISFFSYWKRQINI